MPSYNRSRPRVFVLEPHPKDMRAAKEFGDIVYLHDGVSNRPSIWDDKFVLEMLKRLDQFGYDPDWDYILVVGPLVPLVMFISALTEDAPNAQVLYFNTQTQTYTERRLGIENRLEIPFKEVI